MASFFASVTGRHTPVSNSPHKDEEVYYELCSIQKIVGRRCILAIDFF